MAGRYRVASADRRTVDGITFDSLAEARRYSELRLMERAGEIAQLELQPVYLLHAGIKYRADFRYRDKDGREVVEDVKGHLTDVYRLKKKLLLADYSEIDFREVK